MQYHLHTLIITGRPGRLSRTQLSHMMMPMMPMMAMPMMWMRLRFKFETRSNLWRMPYGGPVWAGFMRPWFVVGLQTFRVRGLGPRHMVSRECLFRDHPGGYYRVGCRRCLPGFPGQRTPACAVGGGRSAGGSGVWRGGGRSGRSPTSTLASWVGRRTLSAPWPRCTGPL